MSDTFNWHQVYRERVLMPDYRFASQYLWEHLLDAMTAHVRTAGRLPETQVQTHQRDIARLVAALVGLREEPLPPYAASVPDLYFAFNAALETELGEFAVSFLRTGLSRNDLDMTVYKMRTRELLLALGEHLCRLCGSVLTQASQHTETMLIAYTHHQPGQPTTVAHYLAAVENVLARELERLFEAYGRLNTCPLGAAALAGSSHPLDREYTASLLGFDAPVDNTYDAVASSDWQVEFVSVVQGCALALSRFVCDLLEWASQGFFVLPDTLVQGSSIMPQKRNPVGLEHVRTRLSRALGGAQAVLYSSHNIPYGDLNDFGPDIQGAFTTLFIQLDGGFSLLAVGLEEGRFDAGALAQLARCTNTTATELADELTRGCGLSFQAAHRLVAELVKRLASRGKPLQQATPEDVTALGGPTISAEELSQALEPEAFIRRRKGLGGPAPEVVSEHLRRAAARLNHNEAKLGKLVSQLAQARQTLRALGKEGL